jgi:hypothetical protein
MNKDQRMLEEAYKKILKEETQPKLEKEEKVEKVDSEEKPKEQDGEKIPGEEAVATELNKNPEGGLDDEEFHDVLELLKKAN